MNFNISSLSRGSFQVHNKVMQTLMYFLCIMCKIEVIFYEFQCQIHTGLTWFSINKILLIISIPRIDGANKAYLCYTR